MRKPGSTGTIWTETGWFLGAGPAIRSLEAQIRENAPLLAICIYHRPEDIAEIPAYVHRLRPDYHLFLRHHSNCRCETVLYAIPPHRLLGVA